MSNLVQETGQVSNAPAPSNLEWSFRALQSYNVANSERVRVSSKTSRPRSLSGAMNST